MLLVIRMFWMVLRMMLCMMFRRVLVVLMCMEFVSMRDMRMVRRLVMVVGVMRLVRFSMVNSRSFKMMGSLLMMIMFRHSIVASNTL
jgi:hypothetical protein